MINSLEKGDLDIVISKKTELYNKDKLFFLHIGELHDMLIKKKGSIIEDRIYSIEDLKNEIIYTPRKTSMSVINFLKNIKLHESELQLRHITYRTMIVLIDNLDGIGLVTKEYVLDELNNGKICEIKTDFEIEPLQYGLYYRKNEENKYIKTLIEVFKND